MKKKSDKTNLIELFNKMGVEFKEYTDSEFIYTKAVDLGATSSLSVCNTDFNFDKNGKFVGTNTDSINSFKEPIKKAS